jgi:hypothetical protein
MYGNLQLAEVLVIVGDWKFYSNLFLLTMDFLCLPDACLLVKVVGYGMYLLLLQLF